MFKIRAIKLFGILLLLFTGMAQASLVQLTDIRFSHDAQKTQMVFVLSATTSYKVFTLLHPDRVVIDLQNTKLKVNLRKLALRNTPITVIRSGYPVKNILRLVIETDTYQQPTAYTLGANPHYGERLVIDLRTGVRPVVMPKPPVKPLTAVPEMPAAKSEPPRPITPQKPKVITSETEPPEPNVTVSDVVTTPQQIAHILPPVPKVTANADKVKRNIIIMIDPG